jgi:hypothetical protein
MELSYDAEEARKEFKDSKQAASQDSKSEARTAAKCTDLVVFEGAAREEVPWDFDIDGLN